MSKVLQFLKAIIFSLNGFLGLVGVVVFLLALYFLHRRRDERTAFELTATAWLITVLNASHAILDSYRNMSLPVRIQAIHLSQFQAVTSILFLPILFTLLLFCGGMKCSSKVKFVDLGLLAIPVLIALFDLVFYLAIFNPLLDWGFNGAIE